MFRQYFMNGLMALAALGLVLTGYNAFVADSEDGHSATDHLASYLNLDVAKSTTPADETVVSTDTTSEASEALPDESGVVSEQTATEDSTQTSETVVEAAPDQAATTQSGDKAEVVYEVKEGDTYGCIAENYYGSFEHWPDIMSVNPSTKGYTEYELHVGAKITLPAVLAANLKPASDLCN